MGKNTNKIKYGNYIKPVGYLSIRQKIKLGEWSKNIKGERVKTSGTVDVFVYHGRHVMSAKFKSTMAAEAEAKKMLAEGIKYVAK